jgi:CubicO group peptidase (beta-lactamase class C family)
VSLLGFGLARAAREASWESLVHRRILDPLGMTATTFARTAADVPASAAQGHRSNGTRVLPVTGAGYLPAGTTTFTTVADMTAYAGAILSGRAPGLTALEPRYDLGGNEQIGLVWYSRPSGGHTVWWHDGGVPGFSSVLVVDRVAGRAVVVLGGSEQGVDAVGFHLLDPHSPVTWFGSGLVSTLVSSGIRRGGGGGRQVRSRRPPRLVAAGLALRAGSLALRHGPRHSSSPGPGG